MKWSKDYSFAVVVFIALCLVGWYSNTTDGAETNNNLPESTETKQTKHQHKKKSKKLHESVKHKKDELPIVLLPNGDGENQVYWWFF